MDTGERTTIDSWKEWPAAKQKALWEYLSEYLTDNRKAGFERVLSQRTRHFTVAIEDVYQERNAGALLRTCDCFGIQEAHVIEEKHSFRVSQLISKGAQKWVDMQLYAEDEDNSLTCLTNLKKRGYKIIGASPHDNDVLVQDLDISQPIALFMGTEKMGLSDTLKAHADGFVKVDMVGFTESFNVSVAAAIILHHMTLKLRQSDIDWKLSDKYREELRIEWALRSVQKPEALMLSFLQK